MYVVYTYIEVLHTPEEPTYVDGLSHGLVYISLRVGYLPEEARRGLGQSRDRVRISGWSKCWFAPSVAGVDADQSEVEGVDPVHACRTVMLRGEGDEPVLANWVLVDGDVLASLDPLVDDLLYRGLGASLQLRAGEHRDDHAASVSRRYSLRTDMACQGPPRLVW
jgi:hypothetical protein